MSISHRPEIDGLRAVAIAPVVLFHAGVPWLSGGYVGVDVFFVISGFLITSIIVKDLSKNRFSILDFYERRIRRIFPALFFALAGASLMASMLLLADELNAFAKSLFASTLFVANLHFMGDTGYFAGAAETKPLLHLWSLGVEEQFYVVFPIYLMLMWRYFRPQILSVSIVLAVLSFGVCIAVTGNNADTAFYFSPLRAWELLIGAVLVFLPHKSPMSGWLAQSLSLAGLVMILGAVLTFNDASMFPGPAALLPVAGTALIIHVSSTNQTWISTLLSLRPVQFLGLISFSLYLWHWPLLVFYRFWRIEHPTSWEIAAVVLASVAMATLSLYLVERPFRTRQLLSTRPAIFAGGAAMMAVTLILSGYTAVQDGFPDRFGLQVDTALAKSRDILHADDCREISIGDDIFITPCRIGSRDGDGPVFVLWGDSHAGSIRPAFDLAGKEAGKEGLFFSFGGCVPTLGVDQVARPDKYLCSERNAAALAQLGEYPEIDTVFLAARWSISALGERFAGEPGNMVYLNDGRRGAPAIALNRDIFRDGFVRLLSELSTRGLRVVALTQIPETEYDQPVETARAAWFGRDVDLRPTTGAYVQRQAFVNSLFQELESQGMLELIDVEEFFCVPRGHCKITENGRLIYRDSNHLTGSFAITLAPRFLPHLEKLETASR